jgi:hypothetical protein
MSLIFSQGLENINATDMSRVSVRLCRQTDRQTDRRKTTFTWDLESSKSPISSVVLASSLSLYINLSLSLKRHRHLGMPSCLYAHLQTHDRSLNNVQFCLQQLLFIFHSFRSRWMSQSQWTTHCIISNNTLCYRPVIEELHDEEEATMLLSLCEWHSIKDVDKCRRCTLISDNHVPPSLSLTSTMWCHVWISVMYTLSYEFRVFDSVNDWHHILLPDMSIEKFKLMQTIYCQKRPSDLNAWMDCAHSPRVEQSDTILSVFKESTLLN